MTPWGSNDAKEWEAALARYWQYVRPENVTLERDLEDGVLDRIQRMDPHQWYAFLKDKYFRWKYTAPNRYATTIRSLQTDSLENLDRIRLRLLVLDLEDVHKAITIAREIKGLGTAGASGLLALMYPHKFGTVDQFLVKALRKAPGLPEAAALDRMNPESLTPRDGALLIGILRRKADENNRAFGGDWTPRKIDKVLWAVDRENQP